MPIIDNQPDITRLSLVIAIKQPYANHNGGFIAFGPDQYLYVATGDGGSGNDPQNFAQNTQSLLGKVLRLDVRDVQVPYAIPTGQPVQADWLPEIVAIGLRNPWRFGFMADQSMWIADVGQNKLEELNVVPLAEVATTNFGWRLREGDACRQSGTPECDSPMFTDPVVVYAHADGHCSITGGEVVAHPRVAGEEAIVYGDFCSGTIWLWDRQAGAQIIADTDLQISSFGRDADGVIYVSDYRKGKYYVSISSRFCYRHKLRRGTKDILRASFGWMIYAVTQGCCDDCVCGRGKSTTLRTSSMVSTGVTCS
jgi:hypothetical protein